MFYDETPILPCMGGHAEASTADAHLIYVKYHIYTLQI